ncbi:MAG: hypothetical protein Q4E65_05830 [Clostridia bacterium]|nr:hypothetical protein [Clostridia bacterium]
MKQSTLSIGKIIGFCGACIAFYIGAGFATMQEVMQYEASYGSRFMVVILVAAAIYVYTNLSFATNGSRFGLSRGGDIYQRYCGKYIGLFYDYFSAFFCYMCFIVMCGGANSTATQQWGLPNGVGAVVLTIAVAATAVFGLKGILNALSKLGPIIIALILLVSIISSVKGFGQFQEGLAAVDGGAYELAQVGGGSPWLSGASYGGFVILWFASFLAEIGAKNDLKEVNSGMLLSTLFIFGAAAICCIALISYIDVTAGADIPALVLANGIHPLLGQAFAIIVFCGIYTTAVPLLWTGVGRIAREGTARYKLLTLIGGAVGCVVACFLPYKGLVNMLYGLNGYLGFILVAFMLVHDIRTRMGATAIQVAAPEGEA